MADPRATLDSLFGQSGYRITSGYRSPQHNAAVGGAPNSDHLRGEAYDIVVPSMSTAQAAAKLKGAGGFLKDEGDHVHWSYDRGQQGAGMPKTSDSADIFADEHPAAAPIAHAVSHNGGVEVTVGGDPGGLSSADHAPDNADIFSDEPAPAQAAQAAPEVNIPQLGRDPVSQAAGGLQTFFNNSVPGYDEAQAGMGAGLKLLTGQSRLDLAHPLQSLAGAYSDQRERQAALSGGFEAQHPHIGALVKGTGLAAGSAVPLGEGINLARGGGLLMRGARGATSAAMQGFLQGFADKGDLGERLSAGNTSAVLAAPFGAAVGGLFGGGARVARTEAANRAAAAAARNRLGDLGVDVVTPEMDDDLLRLVGQGHSPDIAARAVMAGHLPVPVPMTAGQATGDVTRQVAEQAARRGANGPGPAAIMTGHSAAAREALRGNVQAIAERIGGGVAPQPGEAGAMVSTRLNNAAQATRQNTRDLYSLAREQGRGVRLPTEEVPQLAAELRNAVADFLPESIPHVRGALARLDQTGPSTELRDVYGVRTMLTTLRGQPGPEAAAAARAVTQIDQYMNHALERDLFSGDQGAVQRWRDAISSRRAQAVMFEDNDLVHRLTEAMPNSATRRLAVDPADASNYIFGRSALGWVGKKDLVRDLSKLRDTLGARSPEWNAIRAEAFQRFGRQGEGAVEGTDRAFSGVKFAKAWQDFQRNNPQLAQTLFSNDERSTITQFAHASLHATSPVVGAVNHSNSTTVAAQLLSRLPFVRGLPVVRPLLEAQATGRAERDALLAVRGLPRPAPQRTPAQGLLPMPARVIGAGAATLRPR